FLDRPGALFFSALQRAGDRHVWRAWPLCECAAVWAIALCRDWVDRGVPFHVYLLDETKKTDRSPRSRHIFFARRDLSHEPTAAQRDARACIAGNFVCRFGRVFVE